MIVENGEGRTQIVIYGGYFGYNAENDSMMICAEGQEDGTKANFFIKFKNWTEFKKAMGKALYEGKDGEVDHDSSTTW